MITKEDLLNKVIETIRLKTFHENYQRTVDLAVLYSQIISGKDIDKLLRQFVRREDEEMFEQRVQITQQITPAISASIMKTFNKVFRTTPAKEAIDFNGSDVEKKVDEVKSALATIYGKKDIYKYMQDRFLYFSFVDPNAFVYTKFDNFDPNTEKPSPFNVEITSEQAINYEYKNNELQWLITRVCNDYIEHEKEKEGYIYTIYGPNYAYVLTQVGSDYKPEGDELVQPIEMEEDDNGKILYFIVDEYDHKSDVIPVIQVGYERDLQTMGETFVNPMEPAMCHFMKSIKVVSEFDLTMCLHAFPQKFQYVDKCSFDHDGKCTDSGYQPDRCNRCGKTGIKLHSTAQDAAVFKIPKDPQDLLDLQKLIHYEYPPIDLLQFQNEMVNTYSEKIHKSVFNSDTFTKSEIAKTATGENIDMQNVYDTLKPFAEKVSDVWEHVARVTSNYLGHPDAIVSHAYPNDFKLKSDAELLAELQAASTSGAAGYIISSIESDIMRNKYIDSPLEFQKFEAKQKFFPFKGKTKEEIQQIILSGMVREDDIILYNYFETIFSELEDEYLVKGLWFYDLAPKLQKEAIGVKIEEIKAGINESKSIEFAMGVS